MQINYALEPERKAAIRKARERAAVRAASAARWSALRDALRKTVADQDSEARAPEMHYRFVFKPIVRHWAL